MFDDSVKNAFNNTQAAEIKSNSVPDGKYEARVNTVRLELSKKKQIPMVAWDLIVQGGECNGRHVFVNQFLPFEPNKEKQLAFTKGSLQALGVDVSSFDAMEASLPDFLDAIIAIQVKTRPATADYEESTNVYLNKVLSKGASGSVPTNDDIPF